MLVWNFLQLARKSYLKIRSIHFTSIEPVLLDLANETSWVFPALKSTQCLEGQLLMYSKKSVGPRMEPWGTIALTRYCCEDFPSRTIQSCLLLRKDETKPNYLTWNSIRLKFVKKTSLPNPVRSLEYIKYYSSSSPRPIKSPTYSIRYNCNNIYSWSSRSKTILETTYP